MSPQSVITPREAYDKAEAAHAKIDAHEDLCAERYAHIHTAIDGVKGSVATIIKLLAWGGSTFFGLLMLVFGWLAVRTITANDTEVDRLRHEVQQMQDKTPVAKPPIGLHSDG